MKDWFTVEKIDDTTFAISEYNHWEETHSYLLLGKDSAILIDTGLGVSNIKEITDKLTELPVEVVTTHVHWDHIGGLRYYDHFSVHEKEKQWINGQFPLPLQVVKKNLMLMPCSFPHDFIIEDYNIFQGAPWKVLRDGQCLELGRRRIQVIHTPGHSPGHCCFYEPEKRYLFSGDLIYKGCLDAFYPTTDPCLFMQSLEKVSLLDIGRILPGHHGLDIETDMVSKVRDSFRNLKDKGKLVQGQGTFDFGDFQIHI